MDRRKFAKTALGAIAGGVIASNVSAKPEQVEAVKPQQQPLELNPDLTNNLADEQIRVIQAKRGYRHQGKKAPDGKGPLVGKCTSLLVFADVHLVYKHLAVIRDFHKTHKKYLDDALHLGDTVGNSLDPNHPFDFWDVFPDSLNVIGNHDCVYYEKIDGKYKYRHVGEKTKYETYLKKYVKSWNIVQPADAEEKSKCYWYKDYNNDIRLVGIDCMCPNNKEQLDWFAKTLEDAKNKKLRVVVATHIPPTVVEKDIVKCNFSSLDYDSSSDGRQLAKFLAIIDAFIESGGDFVCWLAGHNHRDSIGYASFAKQKQLVIIFECATDFMWWTDANHVYNTETAGCWTIIAFESLTNNIKLSRFGNNFDHYMRHKGTLCYNYKDHKLVSQY